MGLPYLSHSRVNRYLHCPEQYRLYHVENLRPRIPAASLIFGQLIHQLLARFFRTKEDPVEAFRSIWDALHDRELRYGPRESWERLAQSGKALLEKFLREELPHLGTIEAVEQGFRLAITSLPVPFVGVIDLVADLDGKRTVIDFKTSAAGYPEHEVVLSDQLTGYELAHPEAQQVALCVFVKTARPRIDWHTSERGVAQIGEYLQKLTLVGYAINARHFYKRPGWWCTMCNYLPVCLGDEKTIGERLVRSALSS